MRAGLGLFLALAGCVRASDVRQDLAQGTVRGALVADVPFVPQQPDTCGAAALASVLRHAGIAADEPRLAQALRTRPGHGALTYELVVEARRRGALAAQQYGVSTTDLQRALDVGVPPIVLRGGLAHALLGVYHYSVPTAYDLNRRVWLAHDGEAPDVVFPFDAFDDDRARADRWVLFVVAPTARPLGLPPAVHLELGVQAEAAGHADAAAHHYAQAAFRPESAQALLNLSNVAQAAGDLPQAELLLRAALVADPASAATRNNLAWVLYLRRDHLEEAAALARAAAEDPAVRPHALDTLKHVEAICPPCTAERLGPPTQ